MAKLYCQEFVAGKSSQKRKQDEDISTWECQESQDGIWELSFDDISRRRLVQVSWKLSRSEQQSSVYSGGLSSLSSCCEGVMTRNSVFEGVRTRMLDDILLKTWAEVCKRWSQQRRFIKVECRKRNVCWPADESDLLRGIAFIMDSSSLKTASGEHHIRVDMKMTQILQWS